MLFPWLGSKVQSRRQRVPVSRPIGRSDNQPIGPSRPRQSMSVPVHTPHLKSSPLRPTTAPTGSTRRSLEATARTVREPRSLEIARTLITPKVTSGTCLRSRLQMHSMSAESVFMESRASGTDSAVNPSTLNIVTGDTAPFHRNHSPNAWGATNPISKPAARPLAVAAD